MTNPVKGNAITQEQQRRWLEMRQYTPEQIEIAHSVLAEIREERAVWQAMSSHPLKAGGYIPKHLLVAVYHLGVDPITNMSCRMG